MACDSQGAKIYNSDKMNDNYDILCFKVKTDDFDHNNVNDEMNDNFNDNDKMNDN